MSLFAATVYLGEPAPPDDPVPLGAVDHSPFGSLLTRFVNERGQVAYAAWKADTEAVSALHA